MGMLIHGKWNTEDNYIDNSAYNRPLSLFGNFTQEESLIQSIFNSENMTSGRYWLIGSDSCPWSQRCIIIYNLLGLTPYIKLHIAHGKRVEGYSLNAGEFWSPSEDFSAIHLHELYTKSKPTYTGRVTVPILWDNVQQKILCNESSQIVQLFDKLGKAVDEKSKFSLFPAHYAEEITYLNQEIHQKLSNGVYRAGFAQSQSAYEEAVADVFEMMSNLNDRLTDREYLFGSAICISDINLFSTLVRFDAVYHVLHRCSLKRLIDYPNLWNYARRLYQISAFRSTVNFKIIKQASYQNDTAHNPHGIIPITCEQAWAS